jgi:pimeloyl-ACP methyl ester carboxylesterase
LPNITCPVLAIQGTDDEYGTMAQIDNIAAAIPAATLLKLASCGHSPHRDQPDAVINAVRQFLEK